jgi:hypothetical protein
MACAWFPSLTARARPKARPDKRAANLSGRYLNGSAQVNDDTIRERRIVQFCLHRFQPRGHVEYQLPAYRIARVDVIEKQSVRPAGAIEIYVRARARVVFPAAGIVNVLAGVIEGLRLAADIGDCDMQDRVLALSGVTEAISGVAHRLGMRDRCDGELKFSVPYRSADLGDLRRDWCRVRRCPAAARRRRRRGDGWGGRDAWLPPPAAVAIDPMMISATRPPSTVRTLWRRGHDLRGGRP